MCVLSPLVTASTAATIGGPLPAATQSQHTHAQTHTLCSGQAVRLGNCPQTFTESNWGQTGNRCPAAVRSILSITLIVKLILTSRTRVIMSAFQTGKPALLLTVKSYICRDVSRYFYSPLHNYIKKQLTAPIMFHIMTWKLVFGLWGFRENN